MDQTQTARFRWSPVFLVLAISAGGLMRLLVLHYLRQGTLFFAGVSVLLAVIVASTPKAKTTTGGILKGTTLALLLSVPVLGADFVGVLIVSPIFYVVAIACGFAFQAGRGRDRSTGLF